MSLPGTGSPPRVLHLTTTAISLDWLLGPQLDAFADAGFEVVAASAPGDHVDAVRDRGIRHVALPSLSRNMDLRSDIAAWSELQGVLGDVSPDILHTHNPKPGVIGRLGARRAAVPIVVNTVHGLYAQPTDLLRRRAPVFAVERFAAAFSDAELVQNPEDVELLCSLGVPRNRVHLLGNGIDLQRFSPSPAIVASARAIRPGLGIAPSTPVVGMVGRLVWEKGYAELFEAVRTLKARRSEPFAVVVVGPDEVGKTGAVDQASIDEMKALGVHFLGSRTDVEVLLTMFDLFVLPSYREGFPRAAMEASAMGTPVVATDIRGCRQVVHDNATGSLVPVRDAGALAVAIASLLDDPLKRMQFGRAARRRAVTQFDQRRVIARTLGVYRAQLRRRGLAIPQPADNPLYIDSIDLVEAEASKRNADSAAA